MKKLLYLFIVSALFIGFACSDKKGDDKKEDGNDTTKTEETVPEKELVDKLTPEKVDVNTPIPVGELNEAFFAWNGKEVTITGYPSFYTEEGVIDTIAKIKVTVDDTDYVVECYMSQAYPETIKAADPITIQGTIEGESWGKVIMKDCWIATQGKAVESVGYVDPFNYAGENINAGDLGKSFNAWKEMEVSVIGYYHSHTTSTTDYGTSVRVDLCVESMGDKMVNCYVNGEVPEGIADDREGVIIKGIIKGESFGEVSMEECEFVNR